MNILIDYTQIPLQKVGVGIYAYNLVNEFLSRESDNNYFILIQDDDHSFDNISRGNVKFINVPSSWFRFFFLRILMEQLYIPYLAYYYSIDVVHSLHYSFPLFCLAKRVVTVCDMTFFLFPELHLPIKVLFFRLFIRLTAKLADSIICISVATQRDIISRFPWAAERTFAVPLGRALEAKNTVNHVLITEVKNKYGILGDYILFVGTIEPRKNIISLIEAFARLKSTGDGLQLVIVGKRGWYYNEVFAKITCLGLSENVVFTGYIDESEKPLLYSGAKVFVYPSLYEGFGLPVLEALAFGVPTVTSNISSMPEVAGDAALLVNPTDCEELRSAISTLLSNAAVYCHYQKASRLQAAKFTWERTAKESLDVYQRAFE